ncbi:peptidase [Caloranaerobacter sp. TR13]|uniref:site-2 protease family protein n=1 Tax=Caloranaerobacter sp. TR13 TaxID=1302151 RepID=UPI0006D3B331|nr:site-2 protease family protein [Caloranaerobacter sp. TR13]KPU28114.1 peptidase [Caloranaerobacter sp. TR13]
MTIINNLWVAFINKIYILPALLISITLHELAHGYAAYLLGDNTAKLSKRLTLNPIHHIDFIGFILLITVGFGWAKPVPINPNNFKNRKKGIFIVSIAGPLVNLFFTIILAMLFVRGLILNNIILSYIKILIWYNVVLGIFNLLPIPPLDGSKILYSIIPDKFGSFLIKYENYLYLILIFLLLTDTIDNVLNPLINYWFNLLSIIIS